MTSAFFRSSKALVSTALPPLMNTKPIVGRFSKKPKADFFDVMQHYLFFVAP